MFPTSPHKALKQNFTKVMDSKQICKRNGAKFFSSLFFLNFIIGTVKNNVYLCRIKTNRSVNALHVCRGHVET